MATPAPTNPLRRDLILLAVGLVLILLGSSPFFAGYGLSFGDGATTGAGAALLGYAVRGLTP